jgi:hypothetical protein
MKISKSKFVAGAQCLKRLYWQVQQPELAAEPDASGSAIMEQGHEVGLLAHELFLGGVKVDGSAGLEQAIRTTQELIANPEVPAIFEATFENGDVLVRVDILQRRRDNRWRLIEVKSTTDLKDYTWMTWRFCTALFLDPGWTWLPRASPTSIETMLLTAAPSMCDGSSRSET